MKTALYPRGNGFYAASRNASMAQSVAKVSDRATQVGLASSIVSGMDRVELAPRPALPEVASGKRFDPLVFAFAVFAALGRFDFQGVRYRSWEQGTYSGRRKGRRSSCGRHMTASPGSEFTI